MVRNPETSGGTGLLSTISAASDGPIQQKNISPEDIGTLMEYVRPGGAKRRDSYHMSMSKQWYVDILYYMGIQSLEANDILENVDPGLLAESSGYVANHILRYVSMNVSRLTQPKVDWSVIPNTPDQVDQEGAKYAQHLLDHCYDHLDMATKRVEIGLWLETCGTCFFYADWDGNRGEKRKAYHDPFSGQPVNAGQLSPQQKQFLDQLGMSQVVSEGDYDTEVIGPFQVILPAWCTAMDRMPWALIRRMMSLEEVYDRWPDEAEGIGPEETGNQMAGHFWGRLPTLALRPGFTTTRSGSQDSDGSVVVDELWIPPSKRLPEGLTTMMAQKHLLEQGPHKYAAAGLDLRFPLIDYRKLLVPGRFHGMSGVEHLIGPQRDYNRGRQQVSQVRDVLSVPQWLSPRGALSRTMVRNEIGDVMEYDPSSGGKPELVPAPMMPEAINTSIMQSQQDMGMIANAGEASTGNMPQGARSGNAVAMLTERDNMAQGPSIQLQERSFEKLGRHLLSLGHKFMSLPRAIVVYGQSRQADVKWFKGASLNGNTRVKVKTGSMTPKSKVETFERITQYATLGLLNVQDPRDKRLMLEMLEVGGIEKLYAVEDGSRRRARIENMMFARPDPSPDFAFPDVNVFDDHQGHYEEHLAFLQTDEFELLPPLRKQLFMAHIQKHTMAVADAMQAAATVQATMGGGGKGSEPRQPGEASEPRKANPTPGQTAPQSAA